MVAQMVECAKNNQIPYQMDVLTNGERMQEQLINHIEELKQLEFQSQQDMDIHQTVLLIWMM